MPGRLVESQDTSGGATKMSSTARQDRAVDQDVEIPGLSTLNGLGSAQHGPSTARNLPNGVSSSSNSADLQASKGQDLQLDHKSPPEIPHITDNFYPLSRLIERAAQDCFKSLNETLTEIASLPEPQQVNGDVSSSGAGNTSAANVERKMRWIQFASTHRERFIKLLVLLQWSKNAGDISKIIDLVAWLNNTDTAYDAAIFSMGALKRDMLAAKLPNPDIATALEVLTTGTSSRMPDLGYIPPPPLSPQKVLKTLKHLNILLHIRLHLHEDLPPHFRSFSIASGRVTFHVPDEFEVDLSIADEDPSSQFFFIDFRFLFYPRSEIPLGQLQNDVEGRLNQILQSEGLTGCYNFLHEFVLTYKLNIFRRQAIEISRSPWEGSVRVEQLHRSLILQYWTRRPGAKSWIEIGMVNTTNPKKSTLKTPPPPSTLSVKWMREGKRVTDQDIPIDLQTLNMKETLNTVIARHISHIFSSAQTKFDTVITDPSAVPFTTTSETNPMDCSINIPLELGNNVSLLMEPATGSFALCPPTHRSMRYQDTLNDLKDPALAAFGRLQEWRASELAYGLRTTAESAGWKITQPDLQFRTLEQHFGQGIIRTSFFVPPSFTQSEWVVAAVIDSTRESWWLARIVDKDTSTTSNLGEKPEGSRILITEKLNLVQRPTTTLTESFFTRLSIIAVLVISFMQIRDKLNTYRVRHGSSPNTSSSSTQRAATIHIVLSSLLQAAQIVTLRPTPFESRWAKDELVLNHHGIEARSSASTPSLTSKNVIHIARGTMRGDQSTFELLSSNPSRDMQFSKTGEFAILIRSPLGSSSVIDLLITKLMALIRLREWVESLKHFGFTCDSISPLMIVFGYAQMDDHRSEKKVDLKCRLNYTSQGARLDFMPKDNPHNRIRPHLERMFYDPRCRIPFSMLCSELNVTLEPVIALSRLERVEQTSLNLDIHVHRADCFRLVYKRPFCAFKLHVTRGFHLNPPHWVIRREFGLLEVSSEEPAPVNTEDNTRRGSVAYSKLHEKEEGRNPKLKEALKSFFAENVTGRRALRTGLVTTNDHVERTLLELDAIVRGAADGEERIPEEVVDEEPEEQDATIVPTEPTAVTGDANTLNAVNQGQSAAVNGTMPQANAAAPNAHASTSATGAQAAQATHSAPNRTSGNNTNGTNNNTRGKEPDVVVLE